MPTIGFSNKNNVWTSRYSYAASNFARVRDTFVSSPSSPFTNAENDSPVWIHGRSSLYNNFYGSSYGSSLAVAFNDKSSTNKIYKNFSIEGTGNLVDSIAVFKSNNHIDNLNAHNSWQGINTSIDFLKTINGTTYGPVGQDSRLIPGLTAINLGRIIVGPDNTATETVNAYISEIDDEQVLGYIRVYLDPQSGITPQIIQTETLKMGLIILTVQPNGQGSYVLEDGTSFTPLQLSSKTYGSVIGAARTVYNRGNFSEEYVAYDSVNHAINMQNPSISEALATRIELSMMTGDLQDTYLIGIPHPSIAGDVVRGKFAEAQINIPSSKGYFEINALNLQYSPIQLAHDK